VHNFAVYLGAMLPTFLLSRALLWIARLATKESAAGLGVLAGANLVSLLLATAIATANSPAFALPIVLSVLSVYVPPQLVWFGVDLWRWRNGLAPLLSGLRRRGDTDAKM
jgi:hypothetical protein